MKETLDLKKKIREVRAERYACQSVSKKVFPNERVSSCLRNVTSKDNDIEVWKHRKTEKAFYNGLMVCGSVWMCPVCAAKIAEKRRQELDTAFKEHKNAGGHIALLTLTFSHSKKDKLADILDRFGKATKSFMSGRAFQKIRDLMKLIGRIRVMEVTYGHQNGFHPHLHIALFYNQGVNLKILEKQMFTLWEKACLKAGLSANETYGLSLQDGEEADKYLNKYGNWGLDQEMSKAHIKKAKENSMTPFDFLRRYLIDEDEQYLKLFKEYALCFKGKRQLQWSQGLKKHFILEDKTDEQLAKEKSEEADLLGFLEYEFWRKIIVKYDKRSDFLDLCEEIGFDEAVKTALEYDYKKRQVPPKNLPAKK